MPVVHTVRPVPLADRPGVWVQRLEADLRPRRQRRVPAHRSERSTPEAPGRGTDPRRALPDQRVVDLSTLPEYKRVLKYTQTVWSDFAVALIATDAKETHGRSGFYIHGGTEWGSAGCIDLRTKDRDFFDLFKADPDGVSLFEVTVAYDRASVEAHDELIQDSWE